VFKNNISAPKTPHFPGYLVKNEGENNRLFFGFFALFFDCHKKRSENTAGPGKRIHEEKSRKSWSAVLLVEYVDEQWSF
jgi:hypothetical protein